MTNVRKVYVTVMITGIAIVLLGSLSTTLVNGGTSLRDHYVYYEDFAGYPVGSHPGGEDGWQINNGDGAFGTAEIISDPGTSSGHALKIRTRTDVSGPEQFNVFAPAWDNIEKNAETVMIEFNVRWIRGNGINIYMYQGNDKIIMGLGNGRLTYHDGQAFQPLANLEDGWNSVRVVANRFQDETQIYLNGQPIGVSKLRNPAETWFGTRFRFLAVSTPSEVKEVLWSDLKVTVVP